MSDSEQLIVDNKPRAIFSVAFRLASNESPEKLERAIVKLSQEYPGLSVCRDPNGALSMLVTGELQLEIAAEKLRSEFHIEFELAKPKVVYLEPILFIEILIPNIFLTAVVNELSSRGAYIEQTVPIIHAYASPTSVLEFRQFLRSLTGFKNTYYSTRLAYYRETANPNI